MQAPLCNSHTQTSTRANSKPCALPQLPSTDHRPVNPASLDVLRHPAETLPVPHALHLHRRKPSQQCAIRTCPNPSDVAFPANIRARRRAAEDAIQRTSQHLMLQPQNREQRPVIVCRHCLGNAHHAAHEDLDRPHVCLVERGLALARRVIHQAQAHTQLVLARSLPTALGQLHSMRKGTHSSKDPTTCNRCG